MNSAIEITPTRIAADHYQTPSFTKEDKLYNQTYNYDENKWDCDCAAGKYYKYKTCQHVHVVRGWIKNQKDALAQQEATEVVEQAEQRHSTSVELVQTLARISNLEHSQDSTDVALERHEHALSIKADQVAMLQAKLEAAEKAIKEMNERLDNFYAIIKEQGKIIEELRSAKPAEQVVRVVIDQTQRQARAERQPADEKITRTSKAECKVGKFTVKIMGNCAASCDCSIGIMDRQCPHMVKVDQFLSK